MEEKERSQVVIIGAGFGGLAAARALAGSSMDVVLIDRNNYHTFLPLLYQVAAAEIEPEEIAYPIRNILRKSSNIRFAMTEVERIDPERRIVKTNGSSINYDYVILAAGTSTEYFGVEGAREHAFPLKTLEQGVTLRNHILSCFERAVNKPGSNRHGQLLTFLVVGGGSTGVEYAGALAELIRGPIAKDFPQLDFSDVRVMLLEAADGLLTGQPARLKDYALSRLRKMGVDIRLGAVVNCVTPETVRLANGEIIQAETVVWTAGVCGEAFLKNAGFPMNNRGQVPVLPSLQVLDHPEVYIIGDMAHFVDGGKALPMIAPVAIQQGESAADNIIRQKKGLEPRSFNYHDRGTMAAIGRGSAVANIGGHAFTGFLAWILWLVVHLFNLIGFRNRLLVMINWAWDYFLFERAVRIIFPLRPKGFSGRSS